MTAPGRSRTPGRLRYVGAMTGTSVDGLDVALLAVAPEDASTGAAHGPRPDILRAQTVPFPPRLAASLRALAAPGADGVDALASADAELGVFTGNAILACLKAWGVGVERVRAIGTHGQTVRHRPTAALPFTVQIGDPNRIAERTGIDTVADFRRRDMAAGGQGAPLAPLFHEALFRDPERTRAVVNVGGIANATLLPAGGAPRLGFDTGPGNALLDAWARRWLDAPLDDGGRWAASGTVIPHLLARFKQDEFVSRRPPKSTGKETYHLGYVQQACGGGEFPPQDVQATLAEFTAWSIANAIERWCASAGEVIVCGGGCRNTHLLSRLQRQLPQRNVTTSGQLGVDADALEAAAFAWFAHRTLAGLPGNAPAATGARGPRVLGAIHPGCPGPAAGSAWKGAARGPI